MAGRYIHCEVDLSDDLDTKPAVVVVAKLHQPTPESGPAAGPVEPEIGRDLCRMKIFRDGDYGEDMQSGDYGGYRKDILTENITEREKAVLICRKCKGIMKEACISERGEQFCSCCENSISKGPHKSIRETINSLKCCCPLIERGCKWLGTLESCENHLDTCGYVYEMCKLNCGEVLRREELERHGKENCTQRQVKCDHCDENFISREFDGHLQKCPKMKVSCIIVGCGTKITREDMELHLDHDCSMVQEKCKIGCGVELTREELRIHEKENCTQRQVKCDHCDENFKSCELNEHLNVCPKMKVSCILLGCGTKIAREDMELHHKHDCGMVKKTCKLGCEVELTREELRIHEKDCVHRIIQCKHCSSDVTFCDNSKHLKECPLVTVTCYLCSVAKYRKDMTQHLEDNCPEKMIDCPFVEYKCLARIKRKDIDKHLEEKEIKHLGLKLTAIEDLITKQSEIIKKLNENIENRTEK